MCPVRASARPPRCLQWSERPRAGAGFDPFQRFRALSMRTKSWPLTPLRSRATGAYGAGQMPAAHAAEVASPNTAGLAVSRRPNGAVHYGLKSMFEAQQIRSDRQRSVQATRGCWRDVRCAPSEYSIRYPHRQTGSTLYSAPFPHGVRGKPAFMRFANGQQDAHRRDPSGRNPGGRPARQSCRRV